MSNILHINQVVREHLIGSKILKIRYYQDFELYLCSKININFLIVISEWFMNKDSYNICFSTYSELPLPQEPMRALYLHSILEKEIRDITLRNDYTLEIKFKNNTMIITQEISDIDIVWQIRSLDVEKLQLDIYYDCEEKILHYICVLKPLKKIEKSTENDLN